jgi:hypothetical protein
MVPLKLKKTGTNYNYWKNTKPNSRRRTRLIKSTWTKETQEFVIGSFTKLEDAIDNLKPYKTNIDDVEINVKFEVKNVMNDGKVMNIMANEYYKTRNIVPQTSKCIDSKKCHLCYKTCKEYMKEFHMDDNHPAELVKLGFAPMHAAKNARECLLNSAIRKHAMKTYGNKMKDSQNKSKHILCRKVREATGARLFEVDAAVAGNSNTGENLKQLTKHPELVANILDCSEDLIHSMHELLAGIESTEMQDVNVHEHLAEHVFNIFKEEFGEYSNITHHFIEFFNILHSS